MEEKKDNKKVMKIGVISLIAVIIIVITTIIVINNQKVKDDIEEIQFSDFEKIAIYNYLENNILDYNLLQCYSEDEDKDIIKMNYVVQKCVEKSTSGKTNIQEVSELYRQLFNENNGADIIRLKHPKVKYDYNEETQEITFISDDEIHTNYTYKINGIFKSLVTDNYIVDVDMLNLKETQDFINTYMNLNIDSNMNVDDNGENENKQIDTERLETMTEKEKQKYLWSFVDESNKNELSEVVGNAKIEIIANSESYDIISYEDTIEEKEL